MKYPYVVASLPVLILGERPPFSCDDYSFRCEGPLAPEDLRELCNLLAGDSLSCRSSFSRAWDRSERHLRLAVAQVRAGRIGVDMHPYMKRYRTLDSEVQRVVVEAFARTTPLQREQILDEYRWQVLEDLSREDAFGLPGVLAFGLKLQLVHRWAAIEMERGRTVFEEQLHRVMHTPGAMPV